MPQKIIDRTCVGEVLQRIYESDFQVKITLITEGGYFYMESEQKRVSLQGTNVEEAVTDLALQLARQYPSSRFSEWWRNNFSSSHSPTNNLNLN